MKTLLAILSCPRDAHLEWVQQETFLKGTTVDYRFFRGEGNSERRDIVTLGCSDDFFSLPFKTQAMCKFAYDSGYDYLFKCDTDTYLRPERLLTSGFEQHDYSGFFDYDPCPGAYASGGSGYWLSRKAMKLIADGTMFLDPPRIGGGEKSTRGEDLQVCWILRDHGISCYKDPRYRLRRDGPLVGNDAITLHDVLLVDKRVRVGAAHRAWLNSGGR